MGHSGVGRPVLSLESHEYPTGPPGGDDRIERGRAKDAGALGAPTNHGASAGAGGLCWRIVLAAAGQTNIEIAAALGCHPVTDGKSRRRFDRQRLDGLNDEPRPGAPRTISDGQVEAVIVETLEQLPCLTPTSPTCLALRSEWMGCWRDGVALANPAFLVVNLEFATASLAESLASRLLGRSLGLVQA